MIYAHSKYFWPFLVLSDLMSAACKTSTPQPLTASAAHTKLERPGTYTLVWSDEFETGTQPNLEKWDYDTVRNALGWYNEEWQYYAADRAKNARIENGHLIIEAHKDGPTLKDFSDWGGQGYSSARLVTKARAAWQYGYFEIRANVPCGRGLWPAIWMLPESAGTWPDTGEIDIMEYVGHEPMTFHATIHTKAYNHVRKTQVGETVKLPPRACGVMQTHSLLWTPESLQVAVNGDTYFTYEKQGKDFSKWPFDAPFYLILNIAVGGEWGGAKGVDETAFPARMEVDYVRVYQSTSADK